MSGVTAFIIAVLGAYAVMLIALAVMLGAPSRTPPAPAAPDLPPLSVQSRIDEIDAALWAITVIPAPVRTAEQWAELDFLLDRRMRLQARLVPVVPGRSM